MRQHVMNQAEGGAIRVQLDGMINALDGFDRPAIDADDWPVTRMLASLYAAREAATEIETRPLPPLPRRKARKGVSLTRH